MIEVGSAQGIQVSLPEGVLTSRAGALSKLGSSLIIMSRLTLASGTNFLSVILKSAQPGVTASPTAYFPDLKP